MLSLSELCRELATRCRAERTRCRLECGEHDAHQCDYCARLLATEDAAGETATMAEEAQAERSEL